jgi:DNA mismatch repair protein MutL
MGRIKQLSINLINQIAAGEVIERPASVVKELVENSIDAGSSKIEISISNDCRNIRVADNGCGIHPDDVYIAFAKHATSKISEEKDLWDIHTLGFRGEALASICSISKVTCISRTKDFDFGVKIIAENSQVSKSQTGCALGTIMQIEDIFYSQPARLKFLKSDKTEFSYIQEVVTSIAFSHPEISFSLIHNGTKVIQTRPNSDLLERIEDIYSLNLSEELKNVDKADIKANIHISGYASLPSYTRSTKKSIRIYVNSRHVKCPIVIKAIDMAYKNLLPSGKYPFVILNIDINPHDIDVNAHPTKKEIRWREPNLIFNLVISAIDKALTSDNYKPPMENSQENENSYSNVFDFRPKETSSNEDSYYIEKDKVDYLQQKIETEKPITSVYQPILSPTVFQQNKDEEKEYTIIGQLKDTYILIETKSGLEIVDQHIADERYLFEKLRSQKEIISQMLLVSEIIDLDAEDVNLLEQAKDKLNKFGYEVEIVSSTKIKFKKIPQLLAKVSQKEIVSELLKNINGSLDSLEEKILVTTSCKAAIKANDKISLLQAEELIKRWKATKNPDVCPHGRPINKIIPFSEIAKFFDRQNKD